MLTYFCRPARVNGNTTNSSTTASMVNRASTGPRRPSLSTTLSHHPNHYNHNFVSSPLTPSASSTSLNSTNSSLYHLPHHSNNQTGSGGGGNGGGNLPRAYTREEMLSIFKLMPSSALEKGLQDLLKRSADGDAAGGKDILAEVCWIESGVVVGPVALEEMTTEEKEVSFLRISRFSPSSLGSSVVIHVRVGLTARPTSSFLAISIPHTSKFRRLKKIKVRIKVVVEIIIIIVACTMARPLMLRVRSGRILEI